mgnify:CR=1 FL=1
MCRTEIRKQFCYSCHGHHYYGFYHCNSTIYKWCTRVTNKINQMKVMLLVVNGGDGGGQAFKGISYHNQLIN